MASARGGNLKNALAVLSLWILCIAVWGCARKQSSVAPPPAPAPTIDTATLGSITHLPQPASCSPNIEEMWQHVYNPDRLEVKAQCMAVTGTIVLARKEPDGDYHIQLALDHGQGQLLNARNLEVQGGNLVVEPICETPVSQRSAIASCRGFRSGFTPLPNGTHVKVIGSYVHDTEGNHGWMEIHPVIALAAE